MNPESESTTVPTATKPGPPDSPRSAIRRLFVGPAGLRAGWRVVLFFVLLFALEGAVMWFLAHVSAFGQFYKQAREGMLTPWFEIEFEAVQFGTALLAAAILCRIGRGKFGSYGIPLRGAFGKNFWMGIVWGLAFLTLELCAMKALGGFSFGKLALSGTDIAKYAVVWGIGFLLVGFAEEFVFRGYAQYTLATGIGFWPAAIVLSTAFGALHLFNSGEGLVGAAEVFVFGMFACFTLWRTGNLWFAIGFHAAGDYAESFLYSVPDSGNVTVKHLLNSSSHGPAWLTGGTVGPEASVLSFAIFALAFALFTWMYPRKQSEAQG